MSQAHALIQGVHDTMALLRSPAETLRVLSRNASPPHGFGSLSVTLLLAAIGVLFVPFTSRAQSPENVYSGDFDGNGSPDLLHLASSPETGGLVTLTNIAIEIEGTWEYVDIPVALPSLPGVAAETCAANQFMRAWLMA